MHHQMILTWIIALTLLCPPRVVQSWALLPGSAQHYPSNSRLPYSSSLTCLGMAVVNNPPDLSRRNRVLVLGGTGFLGQAVCKRAILEGYQVTSLSRRGLPPYKPNSSSNSDNDDADPKEGIASLALDQVDYRQGDARNIESLTKILNEGGFCAVVHCIGLLFDNESGLGDWNRLVSGSGSLPDPKSSYDAITRQTAFNAIEAALDYIMDEEMTTPLPFVFTSAAEAGWPDVALGSLIENLSPDFAKRYLAAKRAVEAQLLEAAVSSQHMLRPVIVRPSLIYSMDRPASFVSVGAFYVLNGIGAPFVDRPVTVQSLSSAIVKSIGDGQVSGVLRYPEIDRLSR